MEREAPGQSDRREFVRVRTVLSVRYSFLGVDGAKLPPGVSEGSCANLSAGGLLLQGKLPDLAILPDLLTQKISVSLAIVLPTGVEPLKATARAAWVEAVDPVTKRCNLGLHFKDLSREDQDRLFQFVIRAQIS